MILSKNIFIDNVKVSYSDIPDTYTVNIKSKKRYINPLVQTNNDLFRISELSEEANKAINRVLEYDFDRYLHMDFKIEH